MMTDSATIHRPSAVRCRRGGGPGSVLGIIRSGDLQVHEHGPECA
jgi:hypothetical protein